MFEKPVFVSFDYENDGQCKNLLEAWHANNKFRFVFQDESSGELDSINVGRVKAVLSKKIAAASHTLVIVGEHANDPHPESELIGYRNWLNFEIAQSKLARNKLVAVKLNPDYEAPEELVGARASWVRSFNEVDIVQALEIV